MQSILSHNNNYMHREIDTNFPNHFHALVKGKMAHKLPKTLTNITMDRLTYKLLNSLTKLLLTDRQINFLIH